MTDENKESPPSREDAVNALANQYFNNTSAAEALSLVPFNTVIQLVQNQVIGQAKSEVESMSDDQVNEIIKAAEEGAHAQDVLNFIYKRWN